MCAPPAGRRIEGGRMSDPNRVQDLIQRYLDGTADAAELEELSDGIGDDPAVADAFAEAARTDALLTELFEQRRDIPELAAIGRMGLPPPESDADSGRR